MDRLSLGSEPVMNEFRFRTISPGVDILGSGLIYLRQNSERVQVQA